MFVLFWAIKISWVCDSKLSLAVSYITTTTVALDSVVFVTTTTATLVTTTTTGNGDCGGDKASHGDAAADPGQGMAAESDLVLTEEESEPRRHDTTQRRPRTTTSSRPELRRGENDDGQISWCERGGLVRVR
ncbi:hypothetical protein Bca101_068410 [Brassica carinata]